MHIRGLTFLQVTLGGLIFFWFLMWVCRRSVRPRLRQGGLCAWRLHCAGNEMPPWRPCDARWCTCTSMNLLR